MSVDRHGKVVQSTHDTGQPDSPPESCVSLTIVKATFAIDPEWLRGVGLGSSRLRVVKTVVIGGFCYYFPAATPGDNGAIACSRTNGAMP